ncbi:hypothetical protein SALBM311S_11999 [Streptomyces alboniger]
MSDDDEGKEPVTEDSHPEASPPRSPRSGPGAPGLDRPDGPSARSRRGLLRRQWPAPGPQGGGDRRRLRHRPGRRARLRPRGRRRAVHLPAGRGEGRRARPPRSLRTRAGKPVAVPCDIRTEEACRDLVGRAVDEFGHIDVLVNNAAYQMSQPDGIQAISTEQFDRVVRTNPVRHVLAQQDVAAAHPGGRLQGKRDHPVGPAAHLGDDGHRPARHHRLLAGAGRGRRTGHRAPVGSRLRGRPAFRTAWCIRSRSSSRSPWRRICTC